MGNFFLRKIIRETISEYGNFAFHKLNAYPEDGSNFPKYDKNNTKSPSEIDFWNDLEFETDEDNPISESDYIEEVWC